MNDKMLCVKTNNGEKIKIALLKSGGLSVFIDSLHPTKFVIKNKNLNDLFTAIKNVLTFNNECNLELVNAGDILQLIYSSNGQLLLKMYDREENTNNTVIINNNQSVSVLNKICKLILFDIS